MQSVNDTTLGQEDSSVTNVQEFGKSENINDSRVHQDLVQSVRSSDQDLNIKIQDVIQSKENEGSGDGSDIDRLGKEEQVLDFTESREIGENVKKYDKSTNKDENTDREIGGEVDLNKYTDDLEDKCKERIEEIKEERVQNLTNEVDVSSNNEEEEEEWLDILGSGQLKKKVLRKAVNSYRPQNLQICEVNIEGSLEDGTVVEKYTNFRFQLGDTEVIQGLDLGVPLMDVGEEALLEVGPRFAYGAVGQAPDIPPNATLTYRVELLSAESEPDFDTLVVSERKTIGNKKRERGNWWYERENYTAAIQCYRRAIEFLDELKGGIQYDTGTNSEEFSEDERNLIEDRLKVYNNLAAAQMKIKSFDTALESVEKVLLCQPKNVKALFRKGKILAAKGETSEAITVLRQANQLEPESKTIKQELLRLLNQNKKETKMEQNLYKRMLGQNKIPEANFSKPSKFYQMRWGVVFGSIAAMVAGVVAYRYKFL